MDNSKENEGGAPPVPAIVHCRKCGAAVAASAKFCSNCGQKQHTGDAWYYQPVWIIVLALFVLGPFAIALVWKSKKMGFPVKIVLTIAILVYTYCCGLATYKITMIELSRFNEINAVLNDIINP